MEISADDRDFSQSCTLGGCTVYVQRDGKGIEIDVAVPARRPERHVIRERIVIGEDSQGLPIFERSYPPIVSRHPLLDLNETEKKDFFQERYAHSAKSLPPEVRKLFHGYYRIW